MLKDENNEELEEPEKTEEIEQYEQQYEYERKQIEQLFPNALFDIAIYNTLNKQLKRFT